MWAALQQIPYGETTTYSDIANRINRPAARRYFPSPFLYTLCSVAAFTWPPPPLLVPSAVGAANGRNPICICVPCHRVIGYCS